MPEQRTILDNTLKEWMKGYEQIDDICVMGVRVYINKQKDTHSESFSSVSQTGLLSS